MRQPQPPDNDSLRLLLSELSVGLSSPLSASEIDLYAGYYGLIRKWNPLLHLTTLISPADFVLRHLGESLRAESILHPEIKELWDVGSGAGIPGIPIAIRRPWLSVRLIESNRRKAIFLEETAHSLGLGNVKIASARFEALPEPPEGSCITARAVEKMGSLISLILRRAHRSSQLLIFGNDEIRRITESLGGDVWLTESILLPSSVGRYLINLTRST